MKSVLSGFGFIAVHSPETNTDRHTAVHAVHMTQL